MFTLKSCLRTVASLLVVSALLISSACSSNGVLSDINKAEVVIDSAVALLESAGVVPLAYKQYLDSATTFLDFVTTDLAKTETPVQHAANISAEAVKLVPLATLGINPPAWALAVNVVLKVVLSTYQSVQTAAAPRALMASPVTGNVIIPTASQANQLAKLHTKNAGLRARIAKF